LCRSRRNPRPGERRRGPCKRLKRAAKFCEDWISVAPETADKWGEEFESIPPRRQAEPTTDYISVERNFTEVGVFARPLAELIAPPTMGHHAETPATMIADNRCGEILDRLLLFGWLLSQRDPIELLCEGVMTQPQVCKHQCFDGKSIRQCERVLTFCRRTADHPRWVETHLWQVLQSFGGYHDALACFWSAGTATLQ
jgi:hypothetical protein